MKSGTNMRIDRFADYVMSNLPEGALTSLNVRADSKMYLRNQRKGHLAPGSKCFLVGWPFLIAEPQLGEMQAEMLMFNGGDAEWLSDVVERLFDQETSSAWENEEHNELSKPDTFKPSGQNGSHCGITDWYDDYKEMIKSHLEMGPEAKWSTSWSSKKEIVWAALESEGQGTLKVRVTVSDDYDNTKSVVETIPFTTDLGAIQKVLSDSWDLAEEEQREQANEHTFKILDTEDRNSWIETYLKPINDGHLLDGPGGDYASEWGFQDECETIPEETKEEMEAWINDAEGGCKRFGKYLVVSGYPNECGREEWSDA